MVASDMGNLVPVCSRIRDAVEVDELAAQDRIHEYNNVHNCGNLRRRYAVRLGEHARWREGGYRR